MNTKEFLDEELFEEAGLSDKETNKVLVHSLRKATKSVENETFVTLLNTLADRIEQL